MATKADFEQALTRLATGELTELVVQPADFMAFQQAYRESDLRTRIIGQARRGARSTIT